jgi:hypothetical protein
MYKENKERARRDAIEFQIGYMGKCSHVSLDEIYQWQNKFVRLAKRYGLMKEFRENGII